MYEMIPYTCEPAAMAVEKEKRTGNYMISVYGATPTRLVRGTDFGMIRKKDGGALTTHPTLFKSGAEKVAMSYGLCQRYAVESKIEDAEKGLFFYVVRCDLVKIINNTEYIITSSYGSGNTRELRCGSQSPYDGANSALKMAQKRALVSAALSLGCMSDSFTQDVESETPDGSVYFSGKDPAAPITPAQVKFFYTAAGRHGLTKQEAKAFLSAHGCASAKDIKSGDFDAILEDMDKEDAACLSAE